MIPIIAFLLLSIGGIILISFITSYMYTIPIRLYQKKQGLKLPLDVCYMVVNALTGEVLSYPRGYDPTFKPNMDSKPYNKDESKDTS